MLCCFEPSPHYSPVSPADETGNQERAPHPGRCPSQSSYPGLSRSASTERPPQDSVLIKTGGNALQGVPRDAALEKNTIAVSVPENVSPGQEILVTAPDGSGRCIRATVPEGALPGHTFLVKMEDSTPMLVTGVPMEGIPQDLMLTPEMNEKKEKGDVELVPQGVAQIDAPQQQNAQEIATVPPQPQQMPQPQNQQQHVVDPATGNRRVLVHVPPGAAPGSKIRVKVPDGRVIEATVPNGEVTQFYVQVPPKKQNWHDNPAAYAVPMAAAPFLL